MKSQYLDRLHILLECYYLLYRKNIISESQYLAYIKPIDIAIDTMELSILQGSLVLRESVLSSSQQL